ncbi:MAG: hypothetical protein KDC37_01620, partial [Flavobacteriales bacterium]|nr:hypothetical protein [Flavobacteriales bacterium]
ISGSGATAVLRLDVDTTKPNCALGGGVGPQIYPQNLSLKINNNAVCTSVQGVLLDLEADDAVEVLISNNRNFTGASFIPLTSPMTTGWSLLPGDGVKEVYVLFKSSTGHFSNSISKQITLDQATKCGPVVPPEPTPPPSKPSDQPQIILYEHINYGGRFEVLSVSDLDLRNNVIQDNSVSSIRFINGATATVYDGYNYTGTSEILTQNDPDLTNNFISQDTISSIKIDTSEEETVPTSVVIRPGDLIKDGATTVYYFGSDNKRHPFPNVGTYASWYPDFSTVKSVPAPILSTIPLGKNVTYKPGVRMIKLQTSPVVYAVDSGAVLRPIDSEFIAQSLYGQQWAQQVDDLNDAFFFSYAIGQPIVSVGQFNPAAAAALASSIDTDMGR